METRGQISIDIFSRHHGVDASFVTTLGDYGLIEIIRTTEAHYIPAAQLSEAEKMTRLYHDLQVNTEGIDIIMNLLQRMKEMQLEMQSLKNRLRFYENDLD
jgi:chaperone modulatory protein CbpM